MIINRVQVLVDLREQFSLEFNTLITHTRIDTMSTRTAAYDEVEAELKIMYGVEEVEPRAVHMLLEKRYELTKTIIAELLEHPKEATPEDVIMAMRNTSAEPVRPLTADELNRLQVEINQQALPKILNGSPPSRLAHAPKAISGPRLMNIVEQPKVKFDEGPNESTKFNKKRKAQDHIVFAKEEVAVVEKEEVAAEQQQPQELAMLQQPQDVAVQQQGQNGEFEFEEDIKASLDEESQDDHEAKRMRMM